MLSEDGATDALLPRIAWHCLFEFHLRARTTVCTRTTTLPCIKLAVGLPATETSF